MPVKVNEREEPRAAALAGFADRLRAAGYTADGLRALLGLTYPDDIGALNRAPALERLRRDPSPAAALARLFYLEADEPAAGVRAALPVERTAALQRAGLLAARRGALRPRLRLDVYQSLYLLADRRFRAPDPRAFGLPAGDMVYPPGSDSAVLAAAVPERDGERVLDVCTGSGIQGLAVAGRAREVVAVDIGPRAAALARANARLNGADNFAVRQGDLFAPVRGEAFDLILANPPFVPGPQRGPAYHSGGPRGERVLRRAVSGIGAHLRPGGRAIAISHLALRAGESVAGVVGPWTTAFPGRVLVLLLETGTAVDLAAAQALFALDDGFDAYAREVRRWVDYLQRRRLEQIALLLLVAERGGPARLEVVEAFQRTLPLPLSPPPRQHVETWLGRS